MSPKDSSEPSEHMCNICIGVLATVLIECGALNGLASNAPTSDRPGLNWGAYNNRFANNARTFNKPSSQGGNPNEIESNAPALNKPHTQSSDAGSNAPTNNTAHLKRRANSRTSENVVLIVADDLGWADVSLNGPHGHINTPNIDSIGQNGVHFKEGYATAPVCGPSRAAMLTGRYQQRFGFEFNAGGSWWAFNQSLGLDVQETTLADVAKASGRKTALIGKWHLGSRIQFHPTNRGFDEFFGFLSGQTSYIDPGAPGEVSIDSMAIPGSKIKKRSEYDVHSQIIRSPGDMLIKNENSYLTEDFTREAVAFIERNQDTPFFLEVAYSAPHAPLQTTKKYYDRFPSIDNQARRIYAGMVSALDDGVGEILGQLEKYGLTANTLVIFVSDNGCPTRSNACSCGPLRGGKLTMFEGGIRVPFLMQWPAVIPARQEYTNMVSTLDIWPTIAAALNVEVPAKSVYDGVDLVPYVTGRALHKPHSHLYWRMEGHFAIREDSWKLWELVGSQKSNFTYLYDLTIDPGETVDISHFLGVLLSDLRTSVQDWNSQLVAPKWNPRRIVSSDCENVSFDVPL